VSAPTRFALAATRARSRPLAVSLYRVVRSSMREEAATRAAAEARLDAALAPASPIVVERDSSAPRTAARHGARAELPARRRSLESRNFRGESA
jgi:hypothetical protein